MFVNRLCARRDRTAASQRLQCCHCRRWKDSSIRNLDDDVKARLRMRAARHGGSMEEEARNILRTALDSDPEVNTRAGLR
jgi:hypothetical protein